MRFTEPRPSPFSEFINSELLGTRPEMEIMTDLPWFRLLAVLEQPGAISAYYYDQYISTNPSQNTSPYRLMLLQIESLGVQQAILIVFQSWLDAVLC